MLARRGTAGTTAVGKQWSYAAFTPSVFGVDHYGVGAAGFGLFGKGSFDSPGMNVRGVNYGIVNGLGPPSLAKTLGCSELEARGFLGDFDTAYPKVAAFKRLMYRQPVGKTAGLVGNNVIE